MKLVIAFALTGICLAADLHDDSWPVRQQQTIERTLPLSAEPMRLNVDNLFGYVHVRGVDGSQVRVTAHKVVRAATVADLDESREVSLNMESRPGTVSVDYDAPWRCRGMRTCNERRRFYTVRFDLDIEAPRGGRMVISTVNDGDISVNGATDFAVSNVNGPIRLSEIYGFGDAQTVNGSIVVRFAKNPVDKCRFKTINGSIDTYFLHDLAANLVFKTFNGGIFSNFVVLPQVPKAAVTVSANGKYVYHSDRSGGRVGSGGPELSFATLNGDIRLHREQ